MKSPKYLSEKIALSLSTFFSVGYFPFASGTVASFFALIIYWIIPGFEKIGILTVLIVIFSILGIWSGTIGEKKFGYDPPQVVIDEVVGMWISLLFIPKTIILSALSFFLFRMFDIVKPYPANVSQSLKGGYGIMMDDIIAGIYTILTIQLIIYFFPDIIIL
ncbi:MAG: phosphatidylglycerophosphatase A [Ignavibacteria bacterium]|nr:phosphatidylglycerophosphatase A [Ignavibacteria bacterium]